MSILEDLRIEFEFNKKLQNRSKNPCTRITKDTEKAEQSSQKMSAALFSR